MAIYAISDLHLSFSQDKPMNIFGSNWEGHAQKIKEEWEAKVKQDDLVLLPGDFSWAMYLEDTKKDFEYLNSLPGKKLLLKGNHDYWWTTLAKLRKYLEENQFQNIDFIYNNSYCYEDYIIAGTRGWNLNDTENACKIINREVARLELSLKDAISKYGTDKKIIVCMHYPPLNKGKVRNNDYSGFVEMMQKYPVSICLYGHLHGKSHADAVEGNIKEIEFKLISADYVDFKLTKIE